jgi:hypothetical protein
MRGLDPRIHASQQALFTKESVDDRVVKLVLGLAFCQTRGPGQDDRANFLPAQTGLIEQAGDRAVFGDAADRFGDQGSDG